MSHRRPAVAAVLGFLVAVVFAVSTAAQQPEALQCPAPPANIESHAALMKVFMSLVAKSATIRRQCAAIARASDVRVLLQYAPRARPFARAHSTIERYHGRLVRVTIEIPISADFAELLAHELEHTVEAIEGFDFRSQASVGGSGVSEQDQGVYETTRAKRAGRLAFDEISQTVSARARAQR